VQRREQSTGKSEDESRLVGGMVSKRVLEEIGNATGGELDGA
jgi:hypothetical protein